MNQESRGPRGEDVQKNAGEDERRRSRSESSPAMPPPGGPPPRPDDVAEVTGQPSNDQPIDAAPQSAEAQGEDQERMPGPLAGKSQAGDTPDDRRGWAEDPPPLHLDHVPLPAHLIARRRSYRSGRTLAKPQRPEMPLSPQQKLLLLDTWQRSGLPARDFGALVNISRHTLYAWKKRFEQLGPAGLMDQPRGLKQGSRLPELTKRAILMLKQAHPEWGCQRISDMLLRGPALPASPGAVARVLHEAGYEAEPVPTRPHPQPPRSFERAGPNQLWQTDLFTFVLKRQNRRVYLVAFADDHSRFITGYGLHATQSAALVIEVLRAAVAAYGVPAEILTDNGAQYVTWRGKSQFTRELEKLGIRQIVARPKRPQTLGKIERFWGTLWRECIQSAVFLDLAEARQRIGLFIDYFNFQRPHQGIEGLVPADRFFHAAPEVLKTLKERVAANSLELARHGVPKKPFYLTGQLDGKPFSVHREGDRVILRQAGQDRQEIDLVPPTERPGEPAVLEPLGREPSGETAEAEANAALDQLPQPLCPDGSPQTAWQPPDAELPPGMSELDEATDLAEPPASEEGGAS